MTETATRNLTATVDTWLAAYGEPDAATRADLIAQVWAVTGELTDPPFSGAGHADLTALAGAAQGQFPGHTFRRTSGIDAHHDVARYHWELLAPDGTPVLTGLDVATVDADGRLLRVVGFFGDPPAA